jgi:hypothetical protein
MFEKSIFSIEYGLINYNAVIFAKEVCIYIVKFKT